MQAILIDLSGTLHIEDRALPGAIDALKRLRADTTAKIKFVSNTTKTSRSRLVRQLQLIGFDIDLNEVVTSLTAARFFVDQEKLKPMLILEDSAKEEFEMDYGVSEANAVVVGLSPSNFH